VQSPPAARIAPARSRTVAGTALLVDGFSELLASYGHVTGIWTTDMAWLRIHWIGGYELPL
jgi:hypothetical protein